jgi:hypothetical protein
MTEIYCEHGYPEDQMRYCAFCKIRTPGGTPWETQAAHLIAEWAKERRVFTTEDLTDALGFPDGSHHPNGANNRIGRLMGRLAPLYRLRAVSRTPSRNPQSHGRTIAQWQAK